MNDIGGFTTPSYTFNNTLTNNLNCSSHQITNISNAINPQDVCSYSQTQSMISTGVNSIVLPTSISQLSTLPTSNLNMNNNLINFVSNPLISSDCANKNYVDTSISSIPVLTTLSNNISGNSLYKLTNLIDPTQPQDSSTKNYTDAQILTVHNYVNSQIGVNNGTLYGGLINETIYNSRIGVGSAINTNEIQIGCQLDLNNNSLVNITDPNPLSTYFLQSGVSVNYL